MPGFFIERPIFAWVIAILISLGGVIAIANLGVESYPDIAPPQVTINASYPGANAETIEKSVTQVIEQQLTSIDNLLYFSSSSSSTGIGQHHPDLRRRHRPGHRPGAGAEQGGAGHAATALGSGAAGRGAWPRPTPAS